MSDFEEIRNTIARNNHALDDRRYDDCVRTYTPDGVIAGRRGHAAIREFMNGQELATRKVADGPWTLTAVGRYTDTLARQTDGSWLFAERGLRFI